MTDINSESQPQVEPQDEQAEPIIDPIIDWHGGIKLLAGEPIVETAFTEGGKSMIALNTMKKWAKEKGLTIVGLTKPNIPPLERPAELDDELRLASQMFFRHSMRYSIKRGHEQLEQLLSDEANDESESE